VFSNIHWPRERAQVALWNTLLDNGRAAALQAQLTTQRHPLQSDKIWANFAHTWLHSSILAVRVNGSIKWSLIGPNLLQFI